MQLGSDADISNGVHKTTASVQPMASGVPFANTSSSHRKLDSDSTSIWCFRRWRGKRCCEPTSKRSQMDNNHGPAQAIPGCTVSNRPHSLSRPPIHPVRLLHRSPHYLSRGCHAIPLTDDARRIYLMSSWLWGQNTWFPITTKARQYYRLYATSFYG